MKLDRFSERVLAELAKRPDGLSSLDIGKVIEGDRKTVPTKPRGLQRLGRGTAVQLSARDLVAAKGRRYVLTPAGRALAEQLREEG